MTKRKKQRYETVHDENLFIAKMLGVAALFICLVYTARGLFMGDSVAEGFKQSRLFGFGTDSGKKMRGLCVGIQVHHY